MHLYAYFETHNKKNLAIHTLKVRTNFLRAKLWLRENEKDTEHAPEVGYSATQHHLLKIAAMIHQRKCAEDQYLPLFHL